MNRVEIKGPALLKVSARRGNGDDYATVYINDVPLGDFIGEHLTMGIEADSDGLVRTEGLAEVYISINPIAPLEVQVDGPAEGPRQSQAEPVDE